MKILMMKKGEGTGTAPFLNNFDMESYTNVYYVDINNGNDSNPGTSALPRQNYNSTMSLMNSGDAVVIRSGNYLGNYIAADAFSSAAFGAKAGTTVIAERPGTVKFTNVNTGVRDEPVFRGGSSNVSTRPKLYGMVFEHNFVPSPSSNEVAMFRWAGYEIHNCAFPLHSSNINNFRSVVYDNSNSYQSACYNCTFGDNATWTDNYSGLDLDTFDCAFKTNMPSINDPIDDVGSIVVPGGEYGDDVDFVQTTNANKGVYGGTYAWPKLPSTY